MKAVAIALYTSPSLSLPKLFGGLLSWLYLRGYSDQWTTTTVIDSGLIIGDGLMSIPSLFLSSLKVPHLQTPSHLWQWNESLVVIRSSSLWQKMTWLQENTLLTRHKWTIINYRSVLIRLLVMLLSWCILSFLAYNHPHSTKIIDTAERRLHIRSRLCDPL